MANATKDSLKSDSLSPIIDLNVGGVQFSTLLSTLQSPKAGQLSKMFSSSSSALRPPKDFNGKYFIDRDGKLFRYILNFIRTDQMISLENCSDYDLLRKEMKYFEIGIPESDKGTLSNNESCVFQSENNDGCSACIVVGYRGTFAFGRDGLADVKFRKLSRILICGRVSICRDVFGDTLNESRDPDRGSSNRRYSSRFFLKHTFLEQAFENLMDAGFKLCGACASGANGTGDFCKPGTVDEENRWLHYNEFVWCKH